jgi:dihydroorotase
MQITLTRPDDWHLHLRDGPALRPCCRTARASLPVPS